MPRLELHLRVRVAPERRDEFLAFLRGAIPFYESPGGIRVRVVQQQDDPTRLIEVVEYASEEDHQRDQARVQSDPRMREMLERWRSLLDGPPEVVLYREQPVDAAPACDPRGVTPPTLPMERLLLRPFVAADATDVARILADKRIAEMTATIPHPYTPRDAEAWVGKLPERWRTGKGGAVAICEPGGDARGVIVGAVGLRVEAEHGRAELGYWIAADRWGKGYATEAARALMEWGFGAMKLRRIFACHFAKNPASGRVLEKIGMRREGVFARHVVKWGEEQDVVWYGTTREM